MFSKILIANRGEIACRVIETARRLGVGTVAVYSDADAGARHVAMADQAVHIGGSAPSDSYLKGDVIIVAALETGAQAIHPGYGFLSENPDFVEQVKAAGLVFIGPSSDAIRAMGLKDAAKVLMEKAGVPVVPGYHGANQDGVFLAAEAEKIGYPVLIKAVAGGGGKGMRLVDGVGNFQQALTSARSEALGAFGNDAVLIEKFVDRPRHIEVQIFGDGKVVVHLFERDCSLQRRHQKVIEEAPAPGMTDEMRAAMGDAAVRAAMAIGYCGAGTVEFIVDASDGLRTDRFWFMEMNTRLQVEHPVTEAITGVDLVEWQLRVAAGEGLPKTQDQLSISGHAFEARLYAEDVPSGFLPATGTLSHLQFPDGVRADTGVRAGDNISPFYDPMIAKVIVHGATRKIALLQLIMALESTEVAGTITNLIFLGRLARHEGFANGDFDTGLIARDLSALTDVEPPSRATIAQAAICAAGLGHGAGWDSGFSLWAPLEKTMYLVSSSDAHSVTLQMQGSDKLRATVDGKDLEFFRSGDQWCHEGASHRSLKIGETVAVFSAESQYFDIPDPLAAVAEAGSGGNIISAPMPGLVRAVFASAGQDVLAGDRLIALEAMKMEHILTAPRDGTIDQVLVRPDDQVVSGAALIALIGEGGDE